MACSRLKNKKKGESNYSLKSRGEPWYREKEICHRKMCGTSSLHLPDERDAEKWGLRDIVDKANILRC